MKKITLEHFKCAFLIKNVRLNCLKIVRIKDHKKTLFFDRKIHEQVGMMAAARWRCVLLINNLTAH